MIIQTFNIHSLKQTSYAGLFISCGNKKMSFGSKIIKILQVFKEHVNEMYKLIAFFMHIPG